jgi:hypothetical protein
VNLGENERRDKKMLTNFAFNTFRLGDGVEANERSIT